MISIKRMGRLRGKVAVITGGEGSIGLTTARAFVAEGARVALLGLAEAELRAAARELGEDVASWSVTDVTDSGQVTSAVGRVTDRFGPLDVVFSNAGISGVIAPVTDYPEDVFDDVLAVHVRGSFLVCKHALPLMRDGGSIIMDLRVCHRQARARRADAHGREGGGTARHQGEHDSSRAGRQ